MTSFGVLHLTDLHYGVKDLAGFLPNIRAQLFDDLRRLHQKSGPWDLVVFTGDLVQKGDPSEFEQLDGFLDMLWEELQHLGSGDASFLAVPGNHDLARPPGADEDANLLVLTELAKERGREKVWDRLLTDSASPYRRIIDQAFNAYRSWFGLRRQKHAARIVEYHEGALPGDFSAALEKDGFRLGIVGLNTTFLQLTGGNYEKRLALDVRQFHHACGGDGEIWTKGVDAAILLTHQPPDWLADTNRRDTFDAAISTSGRFAAHLCGHMHVGRGENWRRGASYEKRLLVGGSLFGIEPGPEKIDRIHGYGVVRLQIRDEDGTLRYWPRRALRKADAQYVFDVDGEFHIEEDGGTRSESFPLLRLRTAMTVAPPPVLPAPPAPLAPPTLRFERPDVGVLPTLDPAALFRTRFVGREDLLGDYDDALDGLIARGTRNRTPGRGTNVQLIWLHGFGGMGKSWLLRRACIEAEGRNERPQVALIDWHVSHLHHPAGTPPASPHEVFDALAYRLAQLYGVERLDAYWKARDEARKASPRHQQLHDWLEQAIALISTHGPHWRVHIPPASDPNDPLAASFTHAMRLESLLRDTSLWRDRSPELQQVLATLREHLQRFDAPEGGIFEMWAKAQAADCGDAVTRPCGLLADALQDTLRGLCKERALVLALDTCELLTMYHDAWLRDVLAPLLDGQTPLLVLIGSRLRPDPERVPGQKGGWRDTESVRFRSIAFDEEVRFTVTEIADALRRETVALTDLDDLAQALHRVTLGVPLALGTLLEMQRRDDSVLDELSTLERVSDDDLDRTRAMQRVIEVVAGRFLLHLQENNVTDLRDITALALLRKANTDILRAYWAERPLARLRRLGERYALLADGDLHPTVRDYLRRYWRDNTPDDVPAVAAQLLGASETCEPKEAVTHPDHVAWQVEHLNILIWTGGETAWPHLLRTLAVFLAHDIDVEPLMVLAKEMPASKRVQKERGKVLAFGMHWMPWRAAETEWLAEQATTDWSPLERASADLLLAFYYNRTKQHMEAVKQFELALGYFRLGVPRAAIVETDYLASIREIGQDESKVPYARRAAEWASTLRGVDDDEWHYEYYWALHNARRYDDAEAYCRRVYAANSGDVNPAHYLLHLVGIHRKQFTQASELFETLHARHGDDINLLSQYADVLAEQDRHDEAIPYLELVLEKVSERDRVKVLSRLATAFDAVKRAEDAQQTRRRILVLDPDDVDSLNSIAWSLYTTGSDLDEAASLARRAVGLKPDAVHILQTLAAILIRMGNWDEATPLVQQWISALSCERLREAWHDYSLMFADVIRHGHAGDLAALQAMNRLEPEWQIVRAAMTGNTDGLSREWQQPARELMRQLKDGLVAAFPSFTT